MSARYAFTEDFSVKAGFNTMRQNIHKLSNTTIMSPTDTWKLSDANIKPQTGMQVAAGYTEFLEQYDRGLLGGILQDDEGLPRLPERRRAADEPPHRDGRAEDRGRAYGVELMVKKTQGS